MGNLESDASKVPLNLKDIGKATKGLRIMTWTARYRFRISKPLNSEAMQLSLVIGGREVVISGEGKKALCDSNWLTLNVHDLESEDAARQFGHRIALAVLQSGARQDVGIDAGQDQATSGFGQVVADKMADAGCSLLPNVHGLYVYERKGNERFLSTNAEGRVLVDPKLLLDELASCFNKTLGLRDREQTALTLIAMSKMAREPIARAALGISAVEFLAVDTPWTPAQLELLRNLQMEARASTDLPQVQAIEVADALRLVFKSIRQSIKQKMNALGFTEVDWKTFDDIYSLRSKILHGSITSRESHAQLATRAQELCSRIVLAAVEKASRRIGDFT